MRRYLFVLAIATFVLAGCRSTKETSKTNQKEVWQTLLVKQLDAKVDDQIITVKYNNGTTLCYKILDNFGNVALTWDRTNGRTKFDEGASADQNAFYGCTEVTSVDLPYSILRIQNDAFKGCSGIKKFTVNQNNQSYKDIDGVLYSKDSKMLVKYPAKKENTDYIISEEVSVICTEAFMDNEFLKKITIGNFVTAISDNSFKNCTSLEEVELGSNTRILGVDAFKNCPKLTLVNVHGMWPPHCSPTVFDNDIKQTAKLYIPRGQMMRYRRTLEWRDFKNVQEY